MHIPFVISQVVVGLVFAWFYDPSNGILALIFSMWGARPPAILADEDYVTYGIIAAGLWPQIAYCMILFLTGLNNVSADQVEAGRLDGACTAKKSREFKPCFHSQLKNRVQVLNAVTK